MCFSAVSRATSAIRTPRPTARRVRFFVPIVRRRRQQPEDLLPRHLRARRRVRRRWRLRRRRAHLRHRSSAGTARKRAVDRVTSAPPTRAASRAPAARACASAPVAPIAIAPSVVEETRRRHARMRPSSSTVIPRASACRTICDNAPSGVVEPVGPVRRTQASRRHEASLGPELAPDERARLPTLAHGAARDRRTARCTDRSRSAPRSRRGARGYRCAHRAARRQRASEGCRRAGASSAPGASRAPARSRDRSSAPRTPRARPGLTRSLLWAPETLRRRTVQGGGQRAPAYRPLP